MMKSKDPYNMKSVDQLFREKLDNHEVTPEPASWELLESQLKSRKRGIILWRVAAAILILMVGTIVWIVLPAEQQPVEVVEETTKQSEAPVDSGEEAAPLAEITPEETVEDAEEQQEARTPVAPKTIREEQLAVQEPIQTQKEDPVMIVDPAEVLPDTEAVAKVLPPDSISIESAREQVAMVEEPPVERPAVVIEWRSGKRNQPVPPERKKKNKVFAAIADGSLSLGSLRAAKDDLLAFDFSKKNEKEND